MADIKTNDEKEIEEPNNGINSAILLGHINAMIEPLDEALEHGTYLSPKIYYKPVVTNPTAPGNFCIKNANGTYTNITSPVIQAELRKVLPDVRIQTEMMDPTGVPWGWDMSTATVEIPNLLTEFNRQLLVCKAQYADEGQNLLFYLQFLIKIDCFFGSTPASATSTLKFTMLVKYAN